jgi:excinuclease UvrABC ATPase subunit
MVEKKMKISEQRSRCAALIAANFTDMKQVALPTQLFRRAQNTIAHLGFAVSVISSSAAPSRQRTKTEISSILRIIFAHRIRPHSLLTDQDAATDREEEIIRNILDNGGHTTTPKTQLRYEGSNREFADSLEYVIITIDFQTMHQLV